ncbi:MAG: NTP transferase domain-containing protein [Flavobacteriaceae bacterium]|jgi:glucose-1-phosphate adenylyltransferase|nr:NTP transferase domain-containing protein [Flavobacteriaceae bacterium]
MNKNIIILAGGASSRMKNSMISKNLSEEELKNANTRSKALLEFGNAKRPILDFLLQNAEKAGYKKVVIVIGEQGALFKQYYGKQLKDNSFRGLSISYAIQYIPVGRDKPMGTADALFQALEQYPILKTASFTVCNSDNLYSVKALQALLVCKDSNAFISYNRDALLFPMEKIERFALISVDENFRLETIIEKPSKDQMSNYKDDKGTLRVSMNVFKFTGTEIYSFLKNCPIDIKRDEKELPTAILNMINESKSYLRGISFAEHVPDLTSKEDIVIMRKYIATHY